MDTNVVVSYHLSDGAPRNSDIGYEQVVEY
jgi:hypothetical protein